MVTGDDVAIGSEISGQLGMGTHLQAAADLFTKEMDMSHLPDRISECVETADGFGRVFPEHKYGIVKALQDRGHIVAMTGDGVNDAPALKQADCGVAVSGATDAARAAADLILTAPGLSTIIALVWLYMLIWMLVLDQVKLAIYRKLARGEHHHPRWYARFFRGRLSGGHPRGT
jgi:H+-transporting ATPase